MNSSATQTVSTSGSSMVQPLGSMHQPGVKGRAHIRAKFFFADGHKFFVKGVTYGPFPPRDGIHLPALDRARADLGLMAEMGVNTLRVYHVPPGWFLDACAEQGMRVMITIPWMQHVTFLDSSESRKMVREVIARAVRENKNHPAILAYAVGNEIPSEMVRWYGPSRIEGFIDELIDTGREMDPGVLYTYVNYPPTEYLNPGTVDFHCFNVYLHQQKNFQSYLARLHNLAGEKPLLLGEFGMDTIRHTEEEQAELLKWHIQAVAKMGAAGTVLYSWTDEWFTGGRLIEDWKFGLVDAGRKPKKAWYEVQKLFKDARRIPLKNHPSVSVVVCSYNGARTLEACLTSLEQMDYPDYEIILVDDGSTDQTQEILKSFPKIKNIRQENKGLSVARNVGMQAARGEVIAYTDSDCMADRDWLYHLVAGLESGEFGGVGGPNLSPPAQSWAQACVAVSPGQPSHVLLSDVEAEHIPGCNMAFFKKALESIGGFDPTYRKAGDDVDLCWRLQDKGYRIGFSPSAVVWHHRRFSPEAYFRQQEGYGEAEALLRFKHLINFSPTGSAKWRGQVYGAPTLHSFFNRPIIYHGVFGSGLFQCLYSQKPSDWSYLLGTLEWNVLTIILGLISLQVHAIWFIPAFMALCSMGSALAYGFRAQPESKYRGLKSHLFISLLAFWQPIRRGWARYSTWIKHKHTPSQVLHPTPEGRALKIIWDKPALLSFWNEKDMGRAQLLQAFHTRLDQEGWKYSVDTGWTNWDYQIYGNRWWQVRLLSLTEYHGNGKQLTRIRLHAHPSTSLKLMGWVFGVISLLAYLRFDRGTTYAEAMAGAGVTAHQFYTISAWFFILCIALGLLVWRSARLRHRVAQLVELAARDCGLIPMRSKKAS